MGLRSTCEMTGQDLGTSRSGRGEGRVKSGLSTCGWTTEGDWGAVGRAGKRRGSLSPVC